MSANKVHRMTFKSCEVIAVGAESALEQKLPGGWGPPQLGSRTLLHRDPGAGGHLLLLAQRHCSRRD